MKDEDGKHLCCRRGLLCQEDEEGYLEMFPAESHLHCYYVDFCPWCGKEAKEKLSVERE